MARKPSCCNESWSFRSVATALCVDVSTTSFYSGTCFRRMCLGKLRPTFQADHIIAGRRVSTWFLASKLLTLQSSFLASLEPRFQGFKPFHQREFLLRSRFSTELEDPSRLNSSMSPWIAQRTKSFLVTSRPRLRRMVIFMSSRAFSSSSVKA